MSDNTEGTKVCPTCHGEPWGFKTKCPACSGTGLDTTGAVVGVTTTPGYQGSSQQQEFDLALQAQVIAALTAERDELTGRLATQQEFIDDYRRVREEQRTMVEQLTAERDELRAEVERITARLDECLAAGQSDNADAAQWRAVSETMRGRRDTAEAERDQVLSLVERLKGDIEELKIQRDTAIEARNQTCRESTDRRVALDRVSAERDELRADRDNWKKLFTDHLAVESELRARIVVLEGVEMLNGTIASSNQRQVEKLERVIEALRESIVRREESHIALYRSLILMANAGLELPEVKDHE